jgi:hypothetical protein
MKTKTPTKKKPPATRKITPVELHLATLQRHIAQGGNPNDELTHAKYAKTLDALTAASDRPPSTPKWSMTSSPKLCRTSWPSSLSGKKSV